MDTTPTYALLTFSGMDGLEKVMLVDTAILPWIDAPYPATEASHVTESYPEEVMERLVDYTEWDGDPTYNITRGSFKNDRALRAPGLLFFRITDCYAYMAKHGITPESERDYHVY